ncbi:hypothetical protein RP75_27295 [Agrobacterium arsenijevicii]|uniref:Uncharacterized protein n=1 Tax=Agrobacterium arsenijevicii TaxID=1585697 RepID=A0ABR5CZM3_9HYPH|nr:hypothetical protein RP75_27295 [Agrobacterium arsenijevicii]
MVAIAEQQKPDVSLRQMTDGQGCYRDVELDWIDVLLEPAFFSSTLEYRTQYRNERRVEVLNIWQGPYVPSPVQVLAVEERYDFRVLSAIIPGKFGEATDGFHRVEFGQLELGLRVSNLRVYQPLKPAACRPT